jgi:hypothetical protein
LTAVHCSSIQPQHARISIRDSRYNPGAEQAWNVPFSGCYFRYAEPIKRWADERAPFELQRRINRTVSLSTYRLAAWIFALCSAAMFLGAVVEAIFPSL